MCSAESVAPHTDYGMITMLLQDKNAVVYGGYYLILTSSTDGQFAIAFISMFLSVEMVLLSQFAWCACG